MMQPANSVLKSLESKEKAPEHLKTALISEVETVRDSMQVVSHFTEHLLVTLATCFSAISDDPNP